MNEISTDVIESVQQLADTWAAFVTDYGAADVRDLPGMSIRWADSCFPFWNCITFTDRGADRQLLDKRLAEAVDYMREKSQPGLIWLFEDLLDAASRAALPSAAERAGLELSFTGFGMCGDISDIAEPEHSDLTFIRVTSEEQLLAYADLNSRAYAMPLEAGRDGLQASELWKTGVFAYLGLHDGIAVSAAATVKTNDCLFLALVAKAPDAQGKGFGEATVRKALCMKGKKRRDLPAPCSMQRTLGLPSMSVSGFARSRQFISTDYEPRRCSRS